VSCLLGYFTMTYQMLRLCSIKKDEVRCMCEEADTAYFWILSQHFPEGKDQGTL